MNRKEREEEHLLYLIDKYREYRKQKQRTN